MDAMLITRTEIPSASNVAAASTAGPTKAPQAIIVASLPSRNCCDLPGTNVYPSGVTSSTPARPKRTYTGP